MPQKTTAKPARKPRYLSAKALHMLPAERTALIAFVRAPIMSGSSKVALNGHVHYYNQSYVADGLEASEHDCGTAGCIAGYVFEHIRVVQGKSRVRNTRNAHDYISAAVVNRATPLSYLYRRGDPSTLERARKVVENTLLTGDVDWWPEGVA